MKHKETKRFIQWIRDAGYSDEDNFDYLECDGEEAIKEYTSKTGIIWSEETALRVLEEAINYFDIELSYND